MITNNTPLISIVIPCFNSEQYLSETLESCLQQTYPNWEIIVVDDGSTDASLKIARNYSHYYSGIEVISIENNGQCFARNLGMKKAQGEYIQFLDSDDLLAPQYLEEQLKVLNAYQADLSICGEICFRASNFSERKAKLNNQGKITISDCIYYDYFLDCIRSVASSYNSVLVSREKVLKVGGFEISSKAANEIILHLKLATQFSELKAVHYPKKLLLKRVHEKSISVRKRKSKLNHELKQTPHILHSLQKAGEYYLNSNSQDQLLKEYIFNRIYITMTYAYRNEKVSYVYVKEAFKIWQAANLPPPKIPVLYHNVLHQYLGFWQAEKILSILRSIKRTFIPIKQEK